MAAFAAFRIGAEWMAVDPPKTRALGVSGRHLQRVARLALVAADTAAWAKGFFETHFSPYRMAAEGFVTGYYEPEVSASRIRSEPFVTPLFRRPPDLVEINDTTRPPGWDPQTRYARATQSGPVPFFDRPAIEDGALAGQGLELAWLQCPVDAFFIHVQGSARLRLPDGGTMRISFDGKSGQPYTSIGRLAVKRGLLPLAKADKDGLERWLKDNPAQGWALMRENKSFIFFRETRLAPEQGPIGAAGVPLSAGRSLAVDRNLHTFGTPVWVEAPGLETSGGGSFRRLMIAQDTGSAIVGPARGDLFFGSGAAAGSAAGCVRHAASMIALLPRAFS